MFRRFHCIEATRALIAWQFAIRPTVRDNNDLDRDGVIKLVASSIMKDEQHTVNLKNYDALVLVDVYRVSVVCRTTNRQIVVTENPNLLTLHRIYAG